MSAPLNRRGRNRHWFLPALLALVPLLLTACGEGVMSKRATPAGQPMAEMPPMAKFDEMKKESGEFNTEQYERIFENPFMLAEREPLSTFSIDVDTASYTNVRDFLRRGQSPPKDAVRIEEFINYFEYDYPQPRGEHPIEIATEVAACPWDSRLKLVRIGLQAKTIPLEEMPPRNLVFLVDTSGSMNPQNRLPLLKEALKLLSQQLRPQDRVAIVQYAGRAGLVLDSTPGTDQNRIVSAIDSLYASGSTNAGDGIQMAYRIAQENFIEGGVNRVIIGSDGDFNVGTTGSDLIRLIEEKRKSGVYLSVLGFGRGNLKDAMMEKLAHHGNGHYAYIDSMAEAQRIFVEQGGAMYTLANDVKVQVEFNPANVHAYRLVGYENRLMAHQDFSDDTKDAGDMGAGHCVTALYVIAPPGVEVDIPKIDALKYQQKTELTPAAKGDELLTVKIRYKNPGADKSKLMVQAVKDAPRKFEEASTDFRFAAAVAQFGLLLRDSQYKGAASYDEVIRTAGNARGNDPHGHRTAFVALAETARQLATGLRPEK